MALFYASFKRASVFLLRFSLFNHVQIIFSGISLVYCLKYPHSCFPSNLFFLDFIVLFFVLLLFILILLLLADAISFSCLFFVYSLSP